MKRTSFIILLLAFVGSLFSNDLKIGYIDSQKILSELEEVRAVQIELEKKQREWENEMEVLIGRRDSLFQAYELQKVLMSAERRVEKEKEIQLMEQRVQQFNMEKFGPNGGEIYRIQNQLFAPVQAKIQEAIDKVAIAEGYDFVLDAQSGGFVFAEDKYNLTHAVLDELRKSAIENQNE